MNSWAQAFAAADLPANGGFAAQTVGRRFFVPAPAALVSDVLALTAFATPETLPGAPGVNTLSSKCAELVVATPLSRSLPRPRQIDKKADNESADPSVSLATLRSCSPQLPMSHP
ncbi:hypothetical protein B5K05_20685 [Rhizobium phaseoli]|nr:hypothetical protein B5K04_20625 [Rhizobium phaseoli]RDJ08243.1 hypothetical protein B5K05_20685 [Rhizobium phaseoli]